jgi:hypothetical protein
VPGLLISSRPFVLQVLKAFDIDYPVAALELNLMPFIYDQTYNSLV